MQRKGYLFLLTFLLIFLIAAAGGCGAAPRTASNSAPMEESADSRASTANADYLASDGTGMAVKNAVTNRKVIRNGDLTVSVEDVHQAINTITQMVNEIGGFISDSSISLANERLHGSIQLRLPADKFDIFLSELTDLGEITHQRTYSQDVTEEFIDLEAKVKNLESQEQTLRKLIAESDNVADLLAVEQELARVRSEIDSLKGRLQYLTDRVDLSTIDITLRELSSLDRHIAASNLSGLGKRSLQAFIRGTNLVIELINGLVIFIIGAIPVLAFLALLALAARYPLKKLRQFLRSRKTKHPE